MSGRRKRRWLKQSDSEKRAALSFAALTARHEQRTALASSEELTPEAYPLREAHDIWTYRGVTCCILRQSWWEEEANKIDGAITKATLRGDGELALLKEMVKDLHLRAQNYNGYAIFRTRPLREKSDKGFAQYVPVHGGITYARAYKGGEFAYGFDTNHVFDDNNPLPKEPKWVKEETQRMVFAIQTAKSFERRYRLAKTGIGKVTVIDRYRSMLRHHHVSQLIQNNAWAAMNILFGRP